MRAKAYPLLEQTIEDWLRGYLLNRVNKYVNRIEWVRQDKTVGYMEIIDGPTVVVPENETERHIREIAEEATDHIMTGICEHFSFTDDEAVVPQEEPVIADAGKYECKSEAPCEKASEAPGVDKIIALLEREQAEARRLTDAAVEDLAWTDAALWEERESYIDLLLRRIKAEDFTLLTGD